MERAPDLLPEAEPEPGEEPARRALSANLVRLRIAGFKSFCEPTTVEILPGLTGIVGPNGCGKSNVVEALRWAMGESSARSLRGGEMDDVIFAGTATRPARNLAEVTLSLEEALGVAAPPLDGERELEIARRINRGEGSGYRINGREARARDVQTLFADLASGPRASGMVSQGRVSTLIAARPEERRAVLEEAAGIAGLRARRHEAELKLRQAENNLLRADDLTAQLAATAEALGRQAKQAQRYRNLSGLVREAEAAMFALMVARAELALTAAGEGRGQAAAATRRAEAGAEAATIAAHEAEQALPAPRAAEAQARTALERRRLEAEGVEAALARAQAALEAAQALAAQIGADLAHAEAMVADAAQSEARADREDAAAAQAQAALPARIEEATGHLTLAEDAVREAERAANTATDAAAQAAAQANQMAAELAFAEQRARRLSEQHARLEADHAAAEAAAVPAEMLAAAEAETAAREVAQREARARLDAAETARAEAATQAAEANRAMQDAEANRTRARRDLDTAEARARRAAEQAQAITRQHEQVLALRVAPEAVTAAEAAQDAAEAQGRATAQALAEAAAARQAAGEALAQSRQAASAAEAAVTRLAAEVEGLSATLAGARPAEAAPIIDAITVPEGLEAALGAALGEALDSARDPRAARHWRALPPLAAPAALPEGARALADLVQAPPELSRALSQIGLIEGDGAVLQAALAAGQSLVDRAGKLWRWDGHTVAAGGPNPGAARLQQLARLRQAEARFSALRAAETAALAARATAQREETGAAQAEAAARMARDQAEVFSREARRGAADIAARHAAAEGRIAALTPQITGMAAESAEAEAILHAARAALAALPQGDALREAQATTARALREAQAEEAAARDARRMAETTLEQARAKTSALAARAASATARIAALAPQRERLGTEWREAEAALGASRAARAALPDLARARDAVEQARRALSEVRGAENTARAARAALLAEGERLAQRRAALAEERAGWAARRGDAASRLTGLRARAEAARAEVAGLADLPSEATARRDAAARHLATAEAEHAQAQALLNAAETQARATLDARRDADAAFSAARENQLRAEAALAAAQTAREALAARVVERLGEEATLPDPAEAPGEAAEERARRKLDRLTREREEMGPVNLRAEIELAEIEQRLVDIAREREEVTAAIAKLRGTIGHLNRDARARLREVFDRVDREFQALFQKLFGGGRAHIALVGSEDPLEAGLEIFAEPPGKKLSALSLLSGGEQALTALSLIFAVFRCQPAPVCVLDEVDAPLDDANVERLCDLLDAMVADGATRFLIITHHALTMARMHRLYGVTMQERGVSRLLSVDLGQAVAMVEQPGG